MREGSRTCEDDHCKIGCSRGTRKEMGCPAVGEGQGNDALMGRLAVKQDHYEDYVTTGRSVQRKKKQYL